MLFSDFLMREFNFLLCLKGIFNNPNDSKYISVAVTFENQII